MRKKPPLGKDPELFYTNQKLWNRTIYSVILMIVMSIASFFLFFSINDELSKTNKDTLIFFVLYIIGLVFFALGTGVYLSSISIEQYVLDDLKKLEGYRVLRKSIKVFHGPVSHMLQYGGILLCFFSISLVEIFDKNDKVSNEMLFFYVFFGIFYGILFGYGQKINMTWKHQLYVFCPLLVIFSFVLLIKQVSISANPFSIFYELLLITSNIILFRKYLLYKVKGGFYLYDEKNWRI